MSTPILVHPTLAGAIAAAAPLLLIAFGLVPLRLLGRLHRGGAGLGVLVASVAFLSALTAAVLAFTSGSVHWRWLDLGGFGLGVWVDRLSSVVLVLVAFLTAVVSRFSQTYLAGDPGQARFVRWLHVTSGSVLAMIVSDNLAQLFLAWVATSLGLHQLLIFFPGRPSGLLAARKKFVVSRLGDLCLLLAMGLIWAQFGTWDFEALFRAADGLHRTGVGGAMVRVHGIGFLLVAAAVLKSAQFPFHGWLPDTMETPTPVSALMHAGIINAGGFLILRLQPLASLSPEAMLTLAGVGGITALFGSVVMLTQASVKRALAFSTVAQMGFMMLECGLGAYSLALLHLVAHSLYKAHAFLSSGTAVGLRTEWPRKVGGEDAWLPALPLAGVTAFGTVLGVGSALGGQGAGDPASLLLSGILALSLAHVLAVLWRSKPGFLLWCGGTLGAAGIAAAYFVLHGAVERWLAPALSVRPGPLSAIATPMFLLLMAAFSGVVVQQAVLPRFANTGFLRRLYVHARNGFYFNTLANRWVGTFWRMNG